MDYRLEVVTLPVSDVDETCAFYTQPAGFALDVDNHPASGFRVVIPATVEFRSGAGPGRELPA